MPLRDVNSASRDHRFSSARARSDIADQNAFEKALREREARLELLVREVDHRANNLLASVLALARMTEAETVPDFMESFTGRVSVLSRVHSLLSESHWQGADLGRLVENELAAHRSGAVDRVNISGPAILLNADVAQVLAMVVHEFAVNTVKYGALACQEGMLSIAWDRASTGDLVLRWTEAGAPELARPSHKGFETRLIERSIMMQLGGTIAFEWLADGLACEIAVPANKLSPQRHQ